MQYVPHTIQHQYVYASGGFYNWLFAPDRARNRSTKLELTSAPILLGFLHSMARQKCGRAPDFMSEVYIPVLKAILGEAGDLHIPRQP